MQEIGDATHVVHGLAEGDYDVVCSVPNLKEAVATVSWSGTESRTLTVSIASRLDLLGGVVRLGTGAPAPRAVVLDVGKATQAYFCVTDEAGRFLFCRRKGHAGPGASFRVSSAQGAAIVDSRLPVDLPWGDLHGVIVVSPRSELLVRLTSRAGSSIDHFTVFVESDNDHGRTRRSGSAVVGTARIAAVPTGRARLLVVPGPDWLPVRGDVDIGPDGSGVADLATDPAVTLEGKVFSGGQLLGGPDVIAHLEAIQDVAAPRGSHKDEQELPLRPTSAISTLVVTAAAIDGGFAFGCDPRNQYHLSVTAPGHSPFRCTVEALDGAFPAIEAVLTPTHVVRARVLPAEAGAWLAKYAEQQGVGAAARTCCFALVEAESSPGAKRTELLDVPDVDGRLEFTNVAAGVWRLWFRGPCQATLLANVEVGTTRSVELAPFDLEYLRPGWVRGTVVCDAGRPTGISACRDGSQIQVPVASDGSFDLAVPGGEYTLEIAVADTAGSVDVTRAIRVQVQAGHTTPLQLRVPLQRLHLLVVDNQTGSPIPGATISVDEERATGSFKVWKTDAAGTTELYPCPLGEFGLSILDAQGLEWTHVQRSAFGGASPLVIRVQR